MIFGESICLIIERSLEEGFYLEGIIFFCESKDNSLVFLIADDEIDGLIACEHCLDLAVGLEEGDVLVQNIQYLDEVFIRALLVPLVSLLEAHDDQVVVAELADQLI